MTNSQKRFALNEAISKLQSIKFTYLKESKARIGNPHAIGFTNDSQEITRIYQTGGPSSTGLVSPPDSSGENFRLFHLKDLSNVELLVDKFEVHSAFKKNDEAIDWKKSPHKQVK